MSKSKMRDRIENTLEYSMFASRWLMAPVYVVLCLSLAFIMLKVLQEFLHSIYYVDAIKGVIWFKILNFGLVFFAVFTTALIVSVPEFACTVR